LLSLLLHLQDAKVYFDQAELFVSKFFASAVDQNASQGSFSPAMFTAASFTDEAANLVMPNSYISVMSKANASQVR
jgi:hypothetical protein